MKTTHFPLLFVTLLSLVACGSNEEKALNNVPSSIQHAPNSASEPMPTPAATTSASPSVNSGSESTTVATPAPTPSVRPSDAPTSDANTQPVPNPSVIPINAPVGTQDAYDGTYQATTLPLTYDACAGACAASVTVSEIVVSHANGAYTMSGTVASVLPGTNLLNAEISGPTTVFNCGNAVFADDYGIEARPDGTHHELLTKGTTADCHGGVHYTCTCQYEAQVGSAAP